VIEIIQLIIEIIQLIASDGMYIFSFLLLLVFTIIMYHYVTSDNPRTSSPWGKLLVLINLTLFVVFCLALQFKDHPLVLNRLDVMRTRAFTSIEGNFSMRIPRSWEFAGEYFTMNIELVPPRWNFPAVTMPLSPLKYGLILPYEEGKMYASGGRHFTRLRRTGRSHTMFTYMSMFTLPSIGNPSAQELNNTLLVKLRERMPSFQRVSVIRSEVKMLNGYAWAKTTLNYQGVNYVFWQTAVGDILYVIEFQTDNLPLAEPVFENIMESFAFRR